MITQTQGENAVISAETSVVSETADNTQLLRKLEGQIRRGQKAFLTTAKAVQTIRQKKLYLSEYDTAAEYFEEKFDMTAADVSRYRNAAEIVESLELAGFIRLPENEGQARALKEIDGVERRSEIWRLALDSGKKITARLLGELANPVKQDAKTEAFVASIEAEAAKVGAESTPEATDDSTVTLTVPKRQKVLNAILEQLATLNESDATWVRAQIACPNIKVAA